MIELNTVDIRGDFDRVTKLVNSGEKVLVTQPSRENLIIISEKEYKELAKARNNEEYLAKIDKSLQQIVEGRVVVKTMEELEEMAK